MGDPAVAIVGPGRMGRGLTLALQAVGRTVTLLGRQAREGAPPVVWPSGRWSPVIRVSPLVILATPDSAIGEVASFLAADGSVGSGHVILHLSGLLDRSALLALEPTGAGLGSLHPLQTVADPTVAAERLRGAFAGIEGDAPAIASASALARSIGLRPVRIPAGGKVNYHLGATFVANYSASLLALGQSLAERAGIAPADAAQLYRPLLAGAAANLVALGPEGALTGAIRRGDLATIRAHLGHLEGRERRLYCDLGLVALGLARHGGLTEAVAAEVERLLSAD